MVLSVCLGKEWKWGISIKSNTELKCFLINYLGDLRTKTNASVDDDHSSRNTNRVLSEHALNTPEITQGVEEELFKLHLEGKAVK